MADFDAMTARMRAVRRATNLLAVARGAFEELKTLRTSLALYQAGTDPAFNAAVNALYTPTERAELAALIATSNTLLTNWEANHLDALQE